MLKNVSKWLDGLGAAIEADLRVAFDEAAEGSESTVETTEEVETKPDGTVVRRVITRKVTTRTVTRHG